MKHSSIYTKNGDAGFTGLFSGEVLEKSHLVFDALGNVDELNSALGLVKDN
jgi:cob(I)alamin adenosyltransferase